MLRIGICDDDKKILDGTRKLIEEYAIRTYRKASIKEFNSGEELLDFLDGDTSEVLDMVFMDIEMKGISGIEASKRLNRILPGCVIIYLTGHIQYASDVYATSHSHFVLKGELSERLSDIFGKLDSAQKRSLDSHLIVKVRSGSLIVKENSIQCLERDKRITYIKTKDGIIRTRQSLDSLADELNPMRFIRCHNSYVVSFDAIREYRRAEFILANDYKVPISRKYADEVREAFLRWSRTQI